MLSGYMYYVMLYWIYLNIGVFGIRINCRYKIIRFFLLNIINDYELVVEYGIFLSFISESVY